MRSLRLVPAALALVTLSGCSLVSQAAAPGHSGSPKGLGATGAPRSASAPADTTTPVPLTQDAPKVMISGAHDLPYLKADLDNSWKQVVKDQNGMDRWQQNSTGCVLTLIDAKESHPSDKQGTDETMKMMSDGMNEKFPSSRERTEPNVSLRRTDARPLEFAVRRRENTAPGAQSITAFFAARTLTQDDVGLAFIYGCPTKVVDARPALLQQMVDRIHIASAVKG